MLELRKEAEKEAVDPAARFQSAKDRMTAEVELVKADLALRTAHEQRMALLER